MSGASRGANLRRECIGLHDLKAADRSWTRERDERSEDRESDLVGRARPKEFVPDSTGECPLLHVHRRHGESGAHQHRLFLLLPSPGTLLPVRPGFPPFQEPREEPFDGHDDLPLRAILGEAGSRGTTLRHVSRGEGSACEERGTIVRGAVSSIREDVGGPDLRGPASGRTAAIVPVLSVRADAGQDSRRAGVRRRSLRRRFRTASSVEMICRSSLMMLDASQGRFVRGSPPSRSPPPRTLRQSRTRPQPPSCSWPGRPRRCHLLAPGGSLADSVMQLIFRRRLRSSSGRMARPASGLLAA